MKNRKSRSRRREPPSLPPAFQALLLLAQRSEEHEDEVAWEDVENLIGFSHAMWDQYGAQRNSTAPSTTKSQELPEMETDKVAVRSVNPSLEGQDGGEHVTSMENSLEGKRSEELTGRAIGEFQGASNQHPVLIEESESDSELPTWIHPSSAPEGSLLHTLFLQLLGAGRDGITVRELFKCFKDPAEVLGFGSDWKVQVRRYLKINPHFCEAKGYHYLVENHQLEAPQQPSIMRSPANIASSSRGYGGSSSKAVLSGQHFTEPATVPAIVQPRLSVESREGVVVQTPRRKALQKANAALSEQATEFEEMHQSMRDMQILPLAVADPTTDSQVLVSHGPLLTSSQKWKSPSSHEEELPDHGHPIPSGLQPPQAETSAKMEVQTGGQWCVALKEDDTGSWRCNKMAMAGHTLCNHHRSLQRLEDGKSPLSPNPGSPKCLTASEPQLAPDHEAAVQTRVQCGHRHKSRDGTTSLPCSSIAMAGHRLCEHHKQLRKERKARQRADARQRRKQGATTSLQHNQDDSSIMGLPESHPNLDQSPLSLPPKSATVSHRISREGDSPSHHTESAIAENVDKHATGVSNHDD